jgi:hypothetical protein
MPRRPDRTELEFAMLMFTTVPVVVWGLIRALFAMAG